MGFKKFASFLVLTLFFRKLVCQTLNTDESFVFEFLQKMGLNSPQNHGFSGTFCSWKGVTCDEKSERVVKLEVSGLGLSGSIPELTLGKLVKIESLDLSNNKITDLPSDFWSLGLLKSLNLSFNLISGSFSSNVVNFGKIQSIDLSFNNFSGSVPEEISTLTSLQVLNLSHNGFESVIFSQCRSLVSIDLSANKLNGVFPNGFSDDAFPHLQFLNLAENGLTGRDSDFTGLNLKYLNISRNSYKGSVVGIFEGPLEVIDLSRNQFQGHIGQVKYSSTFNWSNLVYLDLSENEFSGEFVSTDLSHAQNLKLLNLAHNRFYKLEFLQVDMLTNLEYLNLSGTDLIGEIPRNISNLHSLRVLDLSDNHLENHIPPLFSTNLKILDLSQNNLTGAIPIVLMQGLNHMERFNFSYNNLSFCASRFSNETLQAAFVGSVNSCPIAANPAWFRKKPSKHRGLKLALVLSISIICLLIGLLFLAFGCRRKTRMWTVKQDSNKEEQFISGPFSFQTDSTTWVADVKIPVFVPVIIFEKPLLNFSFADLLAATSHFDRGTLLAEGRFGPVYGCLLPGGFHVAVKVLVHGSTMTDEEAVRELEYLGRIRHPNLVQLTGYCLAGEQRIAIYDYMENGNLQNLLYDLSLGGQTMDHWTSESWDDGNDGIQNVGSEGTLTNWAFRHKIALGTARALAFLHHGCSPPIIHRDVKASSVYLDVNLEPRLSDFGIAKIFGNGEEEITRGSPGYVPPELLNRENNSPEAATPKCDVYGFGVVLFELITGKKPVENDSPEEKGGNLVSWVRGLVRNNESVRAIDPRIRGTGPDGQIVEALKIGYLCTADVPSKRPSMQQVVGLLKDLEPTAL